jgi:4-hydroxybenzoyl-CoA thioesterase
MFERSKLIRFQHCDPAGIVFYPRYVEMINELIEDWFAEVVGISFAQIHITYNVAIPVAALSVDFRAPSRLGQVLIFSASLNHLGTSSATFDISARCAEALCLVAKLTVVFIGKDDMRPRPWPNDFRTGMTQS